MSQQNIVSLELGNNGLTDRSGLLLGECLKFNFKLEGLSPLQNEVGPAGAQSIANGLQANKSLLWLGLGSNKVGVEGAWALSEALQTNSSLLWLGLGGNEVGDRVSLTWQVFCRTNRTLQVLDLHGTHMARTVEREVVQDLHQYSSLRKLGSGFGSRGAHHSALEGTTACTICYFTIGLFQLSGGGKWLNTFLFQEDVEEFMQLPGNTSAEVVLRRFDEQHNKYKFMEANLRQKKQRLKAQIPDIQKTLDVVKFLKSRQTSSDTHTSHFMLSEGVFASAEIPPTSSVLLWLGANVMLEYPIDAAEQLLSRNLTQAESSLRQVDQDMDHIRDQCTTLEVGMARVYNWDVKERRKKKGTAAA
ncbi:Prefoldin subunit 3 [Geodia barretti]|uniref:Prefoldin subunit 3 n=1 Tax=Geodia barretti TaxID=519541 RepID=A0AA35WBR2_GEOBA|nr:Prefoldin subunit 3 [Geodia barretti]